MFYFFIFARHSNSELGGESTLLCTGSLSQMAMWLGLDCAKARSQGLLVLEPMSSVFQGTVA